MGKNIRILIVDDDTRFRAAMRTVLEDLDVEIFFAANISEANIEIQWRSFDLLIVDGQLPDGDGLSWLRFQRKNNIKAPAVFVSAHYRDSMSFSELVRDLNVCLVLHKPVSIEVLREQISSILDRHTAEVPPEVRESIEALTEDYALELASELAKLRRMIYRAQNSFSDPVIVDALMREAHKLRGTSGTYGFQRVSHYMEEIETTLQNILANKLMCARSDIWQKLGGMAAEAQLFANLAGTIGDMGKNNVSSSAIQRHCVLVLDEDRSFTRRVEAVLSSEGMLVYSFTDTRHLDEVVSEVKPDLVLMDTKMSWEKLRELIHRICPAGKRAIPIITCSASSDVEGCRAEINTGADGYINKSITNNKLTELIKWHLRNYRSVMLESEPTEQPGSEVRQTA